MQWLATKLQSARQSFSSDSLFRNAVYLMASTAIMSVLGFGFWIFVAHLYSPGQIGVASALISITLLLSNLSFLGLNAGLLRFLPGSKSASRDINAALITVGLITMAAAAVYLTLGIGGNLPFFTAHPANRILFVVLMAVVSLNTLTDSVFIANRRAELHTIVYAVFGIVKLVLPIVLVALGSLGIFTAYIGAAAASLVLSLILMWRECGYRLWSKPNWSFISGSRKYTTNNYLGVVIAGLPSQIMPSFIVNRLGEAHAGYFSMAWTMANLLYVVPSAITNSLMAESSHNPEAQARNLRHASRLLAFILVPAVVFAIIVAPYLLKLFGGQYSSGGTAIFRLLAVGAFFIAANSIGNTILNIEHRTGGIVVVQGAIALVTMVLAVLLIHLGLVGVGLAILGGNAAGTLVQLFIITRNHKSVMPIAVSASSQLIASFLNEYGLNGAEVGPDIGGGDRSATVVVTLGDVKRVLKISTATKRSRQKINTELEYTNYLRANGIPIPEHIPTPSGSSISEQTENGIIWYGVLSPYQEGHHPRDYPSALIRNMAEVQATIHQLGVGYVTQSDIKSFSRAPKSGLLPFSTKGVSHFDYYSGNVLVTDSHISAVLDFEGMRYDPLVVCLFFTLASIYSATQSAQNVRDYLRSYEAVRPLNRVERTIISLALLARYRKSKLLLVTS